MRYFIYMTEREHEGTQDFFNERIFNGEESEIPSLLKEMFWELIESDRNLSSKYHKLITDCMDDLQENEEQTREDIYTDYSYALVYLIDENPAFGYTDDELEELVFDLGYRNFIRNYCGKGLYQY